MKNIKAYFKRYYLEKCPVKLAKKIEGQLKKGLKVERPLIDDED